MIQDSNTRVVWPDPRQAQNAVRTLRGALESLELRGAARSEAARVLDEIQDELRIPEPDRGVVTARLERFTELATGTPIGPTHAAIVRIRRLSVSSTAPSLVASRLA